MPVDGPGRLGSGLHFSFGGFGPFGVWGFGLARSSFCGLPQLQMAAHASRKLEKLRVFFDHIVEPPSDSRSKRAWSAEARPLVPFCLQRAGAKIDVTTNSLQQCEVVYSWAPVPVKLPNR